MMKKALQLAVALALTAWSSPVPAESAEPGRRAALELGIGTQGILSYEEVGIRFPQIGKSLSIGVKARLASSLTWATFVHRETGEAVSLHPDVVGGVLSVGGRSPLLYGLLRAYGGTDLLLGYSFTPWDSAIYGTGNLIGRNLTFGVLGYFGIELMTGPRISVFLDAGGGLKSMFADKENPYVIASSWLGSGFGIRMGMRFYR